MIGMHLPSMGMGPVDIASGDQQTINALNISSGGMSVPPIPRTTIAQTQLNPQTGRVEQVSPGSMVPGINAPKNAQIFNQQQIPPQLHLGSQTQHQGQHLQHQPPVHLPPAAPPQIPPHIPPQVPPPGPIQPPSPLPPHIAHAQPAQQFQNPPAQQFQNPPAQQFQNPPAQQFQNPPAQQFQNPPAQQFQNPPAQQFQPQPAQQFQPQPAQQFQPQPAQQFQPQPAQQFQPQPAQQQSAPAPATDLFKNLGPNQQTQTQNIFGQLNNQTVGLNEFVKQIPLPANMSQEQYQKVIQDNFIKGKSIDETKNALYSQPLKTDDLASRLKDSEKTLKLLWEGAFNENITTLANYIHSQSGGDANLYKETLKTTLSNPVQAKIMLNTAKAMATQQQSLTQVQGGVPNPQNMQAGQQNQNFALQRYNLLQNEWNFLNSDPNSPLSPLCPVKDPVKAEQAKVRKDQIEQQLYQFEQTGIGQQPAQSSF